MHGLGAGCEQDFKIVAVENELSSRAVSAKRYTFNVFRRTCF